MLRYCELHWQKIFKAIKARGLGDFVSADAEEALKRMERLREGGSFKEDFDPFVAVSMMIAEESIHLVKQLGGDPKVMAGETDDQETVNCPLCFLNHLSEEHDRVCEDPDCTKPKGLTFDIWIDQAADTAKELLHRQTLPPV